MNTAKKQHDTSLIDQAGVSKSLELGSEAENVWIEVIHKMDSVYADLVHYQVELEQKNSALEEAQQFIGSVLSSMTDVLIVCDTRGRIVQVNEALENLTGKPANAFIDQMLSDIFSAEVGALIEQFPQNVGCESINDCEVNILCADHSTTPLAMNFSLRYDHKGALLGMVLIGRPVGELRRAYDELKQTQQQLVHSEKIASLGRLVAGVAHELNNPISFVFGNMHALKRYASHIAQYLAEDDIETDAAIRQQRRHELKIDRILGDLDSLIDGTLEGAERVRDIVNELRRYSGGQSEENSLFDIPILIQKALNWVIKASRNKPEVILELPEKLEYQARMGQLQQILVNLLQNAIDAMQQQPYPQLCINCHTVDEKIIIEVRDNGPGIAEQDLARVFDPFYSSKAVGKGTGLGLYISYGLAQDLKGNLTVQNYSQGGAIFTLSLPLKQVL